MAYGCDTVIRTLSPVTQTRTEVVTLTGTSIQDYSFDGIMYNCSNQPVANQPFQFFFDRY
ncbi:MAG: hypothetical protein WDO16_16640 [Bacteroidota bacterium]